MSDAQRLWTDTLVRRLSRYVEADRTFLVFIHGHRVRRVEPRRPDYGKAGWPAYYLDEACDDPQQLYLVAPEEVRVVLLKPIDWATQSPGQASEEIRKKS